MEFKSSKETFSWASNSFEGAFETGKVWVDFYCIYWWHLQVNKSKCTVSGWWCTWYLNHSPLKHIFHRENSIHPCDNRTWKNLARHQKNATVPLTFSSFLSLSSFISFYSYWEKVHCFILHSSLFTQVACILKQACNFWCHWRSSREGYRTSSLI